MSRKYAKLSHQPHSKRSALNNIPTIWMALDSELNWKVRFLFGSWLHCNYHNYQQLTFPVIIKTDVTVSGTALSILCLAPLLIVAVGFEDGKMVLYDLCDLDAFHIAHPPDNDSPLEKLTFIEPADDPRACVYVWSFHSNNRNAIAVLHSLSYEMKIVRADGNGFVYKVSYRSS